mgnify:CR=1 FL=1
MKYLNKSINKAFSVVFVFIILFTLNACNENEILEESPLDFFSASNAFVTKDDFNAALLQSYNVIRDNLYETDNQNSYRVLSWGITDLSYPHKNWGPFPNLDAQLLPTSTPVERLWLPMYEVIFNANVILNRVESEFAELSENEKAIVIGEAAFQRGWALKMLANTYGKVPILTEEVTEPKRDYTQSSRQEVYQQSATDLELAVSNLPDIDQIIDVTRVSKQVAQHYLAEVYISLGQAQEAVNVTTNIIESGALSLMNERFGTRVNEPGDVYWDLHRLGNSSRTSGNMESMWVIPFDYQTRETGGGNGGPGVRCQIPRYWQLKLPNADGSQSAITPHPNERYYGRGGGFTRPSPYFLQTIWTRSGWDEDIRNSEYNIQRDFKVDNPASDYDGMWLIKDNLPVPQSTFNDTLRNFWPAVAKTSTPGNFPEDVLISDQTVPGSINHSGPSKRTWKHHYALRFAETYLLRAEAYLALGQLEDAAEDINTVRRRAKAPEVEPSMVDIDYILDERMRELHFETHYLATLMRLGLLVERAKKNFPYVGDALSEKHNLWPIPFSEIEKNSGAVLEQNPGY